MDHERGNHRDQTSPMVKTVYVSMAFLKIHAVLKHADQKNPPRYWIPVIRMLATASRWVNRESAVHRAVKLGLGGELFAPAFGLVSSIKPELRSASIDICLPAAHPG